tara:strand:+ start:309 stop:491 length:183 start_codon:yes stop_codon:yes gene_type:complete
MKYLKGGVRGDDTDDDVVCVIVCEPILQTIRVYDHVEGFRICSMRVMFEEAVFELKKPSP